MRLSFALLQSQIDALYSKVAQLAGLATGRTLGATSVTGVGSSAATVSSFSTSYTPLTTGTLTVAGCFSGTVNNTGVGVTISLASGLASTDFGPALTCESGPTIGVVDGSSTSQIACTAGTPITLIIKGVSIGHSFTGGACSLTIVENQLP